MIRFAPEPSQMASMQVKRADGTDPIINNEYDYYLGGANNGRIRKITDSLDVSYTTTYGYDEHNRLATASAPAYSRSYSYDAWGNLTNVTASGQGETGSYSLSYATNGTEAPLNNQINNAGYGYDAAGNLTTEGGAYTYDAANRLKTAGFFNSYEYDGDGNKVKQTNNGETIYYLWSSVLGEPVVEWMEGEFFHGVYRAYVYGPGGGQVVAMQSHDGQFYWAHTDHLGSGRKLTDTSGNMVYRGEFDPHGQSLYEWHATGQINLNSHKYTGYERDWATNLDNAKARTYHHNRGRFMQPDPLGLGAADTTNPQSLNLYSYTKNDPMNFTDPKGMTSCWAPDGSSDCDRVWWGLAPNKSGVPAWFEELLAGGGGLSQSKNPQPVGEVKKDNSQALGELHDCYKKVAEQFKGKFPNPISGTTTSSALSALANLVGNFAQDRIVSLRPSYNPGLDGPLEIDPPKATPLGTLLKNTALSVAIADALIVTYNVVVDSGPAAAVNGGIIDGRNRCRSEVNSKYGTNFGPELEDFQNEQLQNSLIAPSHVP